MPTSATGTEPARGFTLIELLVTLVIMGLVSGLVVLSWPAQDRAVQKLAERIAARMHLAAEQSVVSGTPHGVVLQGRSLQFIAFRNGQWRGLPEDRWLGPVTWDGGVSARLENEGASAEPVVQDKTAIVPEIVFEPTGLVTPFRLLLARDSAEFTIAANNRGDITIIRAKDHATR